LTGSKSCSKIYKVTLPYLPTPLSGSASTTPTARALPVETSWGAINRDIFILDADNEFVAAFNCTTNSLSTPSNYATLRALMVDALNF
jgi:hypothetical protein